jgi:hypothetical protein
VFNVQVSISGAKKFKGIRATMYQQAELHRAFCKDHRKAIFYDGDDLKLVLLFKQENEAMNFQTLLRQWNVQRPLGRFPEPDVAKLEQVPLQPDIQPILLNQYEANDENDSPMTSLADFQGCSLSRPSSIDVETDLGKFQSVEKPEWLLVGGCKAYRMHLKNQGAKFKHDKALANDENNMLAGTWTFHQFFDGLNHDKKLPVLAIKPGEIKEEVEVEPGHKRRKVMLDIEFHNDVAETAVSVILKNGSKRISPLHWESFVFVRDPKTFNESCQWKYDETKKLWKEEEDLLNSE